jgi:hypothetical protein
MIQECLCACLLVFVSCPLFFYLDPTVVVPGHKRRQRVVSLRRRSGDRPLHYKHNAVVVFLLIGRTEAPQYENFSSNRREISRPAPYLLQKHLKESAKVGYS